MTSSEVKNVVEAMIFASEEPLTISRLGRMLSERFQVSSSDLKNIVDSLKSDYEARGVELAETASGFSFKTREIYKDNLGILWEGRKPRYTRAFLETMAIIAYKQPVTRGEIEDIRGVAASTSIVRQLLDRDWIRPVGKRDVPGRPTLYGTTNAFLDYFGLRSINDLPEFEGELIENLSNSIGQISGVRDPDGAPE